MIDLFIVNVSGLNFQSKLVCSDDYEDMSGSRFENQIESYLIIDVDQRFKCIMVIGDVCRAKTSEDWWVTVRKLIPIKNGVLWVLCVGIFVNHFNLFLCSMRRLKKKQQHLKRLKQEDIGRIKKIKTDEVCFHNNDFQLR